MKKNISLFLMILSFCVVSVFGNVTTALTSQEAKRVDMASPVNAKVKLGTKLKAVIDNDTNLVGLGNYTKVALVSYNYSTDYDTFAVLYTSVNDTPTNSITKLSHGLITGDVLDFTTSDSHLYVAGLQIDNDSIFYAIKVDNNNFNLATSRANALGGTVAVITSVGTGTHTVHINRTGSIDLGVDLPDNAIIIESYVEPLTANAGGSVAITVNATGDIIAAANIDPATMIRGLQSTGASPTILKTSAATPIIADITNGDLTAAKFNVYIIYVQGD